jgi:effector-binding domain-containing protein
MERGKYYKTILKGSYNNSKLAWENAYGGAGNLTDFVVNEKGEPFEIYVNNPDTTTNPADLITEIYIPVVHNDALN